MIIPPNNQWTQTNRSDKLGSLWSTFNTDMQSNLGKLRITRTLRTTDESSVATLTRPPSRFVVFKDNVTTKIWTTGGTKILSATATSPANAFVLDTTTDSPTTEGANEDIVVFNNALYATASGSLWKNAAAGAWVANGTSISAGVPHSLCAFGGGTAERLYITRGNVTKGIYSMSLADSIATSSANTLTLPLELVPIWIRASQNSLWIGTVNTRGGKAVVFRWNGVSEQYQNAYTLQATGALSCVIKNDVPWVMDSNARLLAFNGSYFQEVARLPIEGKFLTNPSAFDATTFGDPGGLPFIHQNGIAVVNDRIHMLINNEIADAGASVRENLPSGIWEYDEQIGLYHKYSLSYAPRPDLGSATITDYGQNRVAAVGGLSDMRINNTGASNGGTFLAGALLYTSATVTSGGIFTDDTYETIDGAASTTAGTTTQAGGYIVTSKIYAKNIADAWQKVTTRYKKQMISADKMWIKYRTSEENPTSFSLTWTSTTTFTTTTNVLGLEGFEFECLQGKGGGRMEKVTLISHASGTYTVTIANAVANASGTAKGRIQKWIELGTVTDQTSQFKDFGIGVNTPWIQFKVVFLSTKGEFDDMILINAPHQK